jgi:predicted RecB family nuclease
MKIVGGEMRLAATDVSNHLACHHLTGLELSAARGECERPKWEAPDLVVIQELGLRHEAKYLKFLEKSGLRVLNLGSGTQVATTTPAGPEGPGDEGRVAAETLAAMEAGVDVIAQGALRSGRWFGRPDVLRKVAGRSRFGDWSYQVYDCKLAKETKATTILQLSFYSELLGEILRAPAVEIKGNVTNPDLTPRGAQKSFSWDEKISTRATNDSGTRQLVRNSAVPVRQIDRQTLPEFMWVVPPGTKGDAFVPERYRVEEFAAYYRYVKGQLERACESGSPAGQETYPEPCLHCDVCRWFRVCENRRRSDDHLSLVAGIRRQQRDQLELWKSDTVAKLAELPIPLKVKPLHGSREGIERVREQARVQVEGRTQKKLIHEPLTVLAGTGFCKLPEPSRGDVFVDLEGDPFAGDDGLQYLFGYAETGEDGKLRYEKRWAFNAEQEKRGFEWFVDAVTTRRKEYPAMHVYHFGVYEPAAFKRLMGLYATREEEIDNMLRAALFVDLHTVFKQALRASVEEYSLKKLEAFCGFQRTVQPEESRAAMRYIEHRLELGRVDEEVPENFREAMEGYNRDDCFATAALRDWLERERAKRLSAGYAVERPQAVDGAPTEELDARQKRVTALVAALTAAVPAEAAARTPEQASTWMLAQLLDFHRRENKATWWEGFRLADLDDDELLEDRAGLAGLKFLNRLAVDKKIPTDRYSFTKQETEVRCDKDVYRDGERFGCVVEMDQAALTVDVKKTRKTAETHPSGVYAWDRPVNVDNHSDSLLRIGDWVHANGVDGKGQFRAVRDLLLRKAPRLLRGETISPLPAEEPKTTACRIVSALDHSVFAIQGPPGAGKTYTGARMICQLVAEGKKVGVSALSHKVIRKLLEEVVGAASQDDVKQLRCMQKLSEHDDMEMIPEISVTRDNEEPLAALMNGTANVLGGTSWLWTRPEFFESVDALFIDEAGQMALADVVAVGQAARNLVLIGDPQQLERPLKGSHPAGAEKSALEHLIGEHKTIPSDQGMLLPETWRMHPNICEFTSEMFYEARLHPRPTLDQQILAGHPWMNGAGLWFVPAHHTGCRNSSAQEVEVVKQIVESLIAPGVRWFWSTTNSKPMTLDQILIVAPYNAQVSDLLVALPNGARVGTVDKFQGQQAPVVIYSLTTSTPEDAPRGMEFLYSLNRFNVATSRAQTAVIVVASPALFEPDCRSPRQMQLANAFCAYLEKAKVVELHDGKN